MRLPGEGEGEGGKNRKRLKIAAAALVVGAVYYFISRQLGHLDLQQLLKDVSNTLGAWTYLLVGFFAFAYAYAKGYEGGNGVVEGIRFGVLVSLIVIGFGLIWQYVMFPITATYAAAIVIDSIVELALYGAIVGAIYKPAVVPARKAAAV
jgi:hypothetical protein